MPCSISLCIIAKDEEKQIARCINSAKPFVDQIVVVDTGSTDKTVDIAKELGAEVYKITWQDDFSQARNISLEYATGDWILFLDCDEELDSATAPTLKKLVNDDNYDAYWLQFINIFNNRPSTSFLAFRLFRNNPLFRFECRIHEQILPSVLRHISPARIGLADVTVYHYGYEKNTIESKNKIERNIRLLEKARQEYGNSGFIAFYLGVEQQRMGNYQKALEYYTESLDKSSLDANYVPAMLRAMAYCFISLGRYQEGLSLLNRYLPVYPDYTDLMYLKGLLYFELGKYHRALDCMNKCIAMGPPPQRYFSVCGIADEKPQKFIHILTRNLIYYSAILIKKGLTSQAFPVLDTVFTQLQKTPDEDLYINLVEVMLLLTKQAADGLPCR
ncbi:glycosyltransferase involved in cell wall biosynthesis [Desulfohalotomaculum tongense]|uniref:glycosyltransferase n=1 Tax=Desulforadius tongensis TaxID=1216062 RepID=UPI00195A2A7C|nr:glycosyltransferase [Desulforadius tongensis]MBM7854298.1 glycosyltransferase involved in cell wall biosynthesis [Desulforadius tongensis]